MLNQYNYFINKDINNTNEVNANYNIPFKRKTEDLPSEDEEVNPTKKICWRYKNNKIYTWY